MFTIRSFNPTDTEYAEVVAIHNALWPDDPATVESWQYWDASRDPKYLFQRLVVEQNDNMVAFGGYGDSHWSCQPGKYWFDYTIPPAFDGQGIDTIFYDYVMQRLLAREATIITAEAREDQPLKVTLLKANGFERTMRYPRSMLALDQFDPVPFRPALEKVKQAGLKIDSLAELQHRYPDWQERLYELHWPIMQDIPAPDPPTRDPFEQFIKEFTAPEFRADSWFIGLDGNDWVGLSFLWINKANPVKVNTGMTGVLREYRRKGLATAMKLMGFDFARAQGFRLIETDNEENNPMYQLNLQLGFQPAPAWLGFKKVLQPA